MTGRRHDAKVTVAGHHSLEISEISASSKTAQNLQPQSPVGRCARVMMMLALMGCIVPIPAEQSELDAGTHNADPVIVNFTPPLPSTVSRNQEQIFTVTLRDADLHDTLYLRVFRTGTKDALHASIPVSNDPTRGTEERTAKVSTQKWCDFSGAEGLTYIVIVFEVGDREFESDPTSHKVVGANGKTSEQLWVVDCI